MTREEENAALRAENAAWRAENAARKNELRTLRQQVDQLATALQAAQTRLREVEAKKTVPPAFTKANGAKKPRQARKKRPPEQNHSRLVLVMGAPLNLLSIPTSQ
jgi:chromosome segregation ATPase